MVVRGGRGRAEDDAGSTRDCRINFGHGPSFRALPMALVQSSEPVSGLLSTPRPYIPLRRRRPVRTFSLFPIYVRQWGMRFWRMRPLRECLAETLRMLVLTKAHECKVCNHAPPYSPFLSRARVFAVPSSVNLTISFAMTDIRSILPLLHLPP